MIIRQFAGIDSSIIDQAKEGWGLDKATTGANLVETLTKLSQA